MEICAGIVLFHPDIGRLKQNISAVLPQADRLVLINNAPEEAGQLKEEVCAITAGIDENPGGIAVIDWIENNENLGIAAALNQLMTHAEQNGYKWVLTLDQDSIGKPR